ncbi:lyase family protein, partial [Allobacillus saliphilus]
MAVEIRHLQKSETREAEEFFSKGQKGSSAMPHKRNPIGSENMTGMARVIRGHVITAFENVPLWHERDISHSSAERIILPDTTIALDYMLNRFTNILDNLVVYEDQMIDNIQRTYGLIFSQRVLLTLIEQGFSREKAYDLVQPLAMQAWEEKRSFPELVKANEEIQSTLTQEELASCFDLTYHLKSVDMIFERIGLN